MPHQVNCPSCGRVLKVPDSVKTSQLSCPRCLAKFDNPAASTPAAEEPPLTVTLAEPQAAARGRPDHGRAVTIVDEDVRRDTRGTSVVLILLAVLGGLGLLFYFWIGLGSLQQGGSQILIAVTLTFLFLSLLTTGIMFWRTRDNSSERGIGRVILGTLAMTGVLFALSCGIGLAMIIYFFVACLTSLPGSFH
jgi:hypothetical protein